MKSGTSWATWVIPSIAVFLAVAAVPAGAQQGAPAEANPPAESVAVPPGYVIGIDDDLSIRFWRDTGLSADVTVRPDGKISLPLLDDVPAEGYTPEQLRDVLAKAATKFIADPSVSVLVRAIRSRKVYVLGEVARPGVVPLNREMNVLQLIAEVGGLAEWANKDDIVVMRQEAGKQRRYRFNYDEVIRGRNPDQNIVLKPGDTVIVR